jgi:hypothetical protein
MHKAWYYSMCLKNMMWTNGRACNWQKLVKFEVPVTKVGLGPCVKLIVCYQQCLGGA